MENTDNKQSSRQLFEAQARRREAQHLQDIESNPLDADQIAMFEMFEREGWSHEKRLAYIKQRARNAGLVPAAE